jgi:hypothetical protein
MQRVKARQLVSQGARVRFNPRTLPQLRPTARLRAGQKREASRGRLNPAGTVRSHGLSCCDRVDFGASGADDLIGGTEDFLSALFGNRVRLKTTPRLIQF